jgi:Phosphatidylinositol 3- and 4-kinase
MRVAGVARAMNLRPYLAGLAILFASSTAGAQVHAPLPSPPVEAPAAAVHPPPSAPKPPAASHPAVNVVPAPGPATLPKSVVLHAPTAADAPAQTHHTAAASVTTAHGSPSTTDTAQTEHWGATGRDLANGHVESTVANAQHGVMGSQIVSVRLQDGRTVRVVFKPVSGERDWGAYKKGSLYVREIAASRLSDELGFHLVPPTVELTVNGEKGSAQLFVEGAPIANAVPNKTRMDPARRELLTVFDYLLANSDRHGANWLVRDTNGKQEPVAIDHGLAFPSAQNWSPAVPTNLRPETRALLTNASPERVARTLVDSGLDDAATKGVLTRLEIVRAANGGPPAEQPAQLDAYVAAAHQK